VLVSRNASKIQIALAYNNLSYCCLRENKFTLAELWSKKGIKKHGLGTYYLYKNLGDALNV
jgi:hypothetical protein